MTTAVIRIVTDLGAIVVALYGDAAPITVDNFLNYVDAGHYQGANFYRATRKGADGSGIAVIQGGRFVKGEVLAPPVRILSMERLAITDREAF